MSRDYVGDAWLRIAVSALDFQKEVDKATGPIRKKLDAIGASARNVGKLMTLGMTVPLIAGFGVAVKSAAAFEKTLTNAAAVAGATDNEFKQMSETAKKMGSTTVFSATESAQAMYYLASAGIKANSMASVLEPTLALAAATQSDLAQTTDAVVASLNQFGMKSDETGRISNVFAAAISASQATLDKLQSSMRYVGPVSNALGISIEETTGTLMALYNAGFKGEQAGTILRASMTSLIKPSTDAQKTLASLGLSAKDVSPELHSLADIVDLLREKGISTKQIMAIFGQEAGPGMAALIQVGGAAMRDYTQQVTNTNKASEMATKQLESFSNKVKLFQGKLSNAAITIGNDVIPVLSDLMDNALTPLIDKFDKATPETQKFITKVGLIAAAAGPAVWAIGAMATAAAAILSPVGLATTGFLLLSGALIKFKLSSDDAKESLRSTYHVLGSSGIRENIDETTESIKRQTRAIRERAAWKQYYGNLGGDYDETSWRNQTAAVPATKTKTKTKDGGGGGSDEAASALEKIKSASESLHESLQGDWISTTKTQSEQLDIWYQDQVSALEKVKGASATYTEDRMMLDETYQAKKKALLDEELAAAMELSGKILADEQERHTKQLTLAEVRAVKEQTIYERLNADRQAADLQAYQQTLSEENVMFLADLESKRTAMDDYYTLQMDSHRTWLDTVNEMTMSFHEGFASAASAVVTGSQSAGEALKAVGSQLLGILVEWMVKKTTASVLAKTLMATETAASVAMAATVASAWANAAAMVSLASFGANSAAAMAGIASTVAFAQGLSIPALAEGAVITGPTVAMIGEGHETEVVQPLSKLKALLAGNGGSGRSSSSGSFMLDMKNYFYGDIRTDADIDAIAARLGKQVAVVIRGAV